MYLKKSFYQIVYIFLFLFLWSCSKRDADIIRIGILHGPTEISFMKMISENEDIATKKVEFIIKDEPLQIQSLMMRNEVDFAVLPTVMAVNLYNKGMKYQMLACPVWGTLYLVSNDKDIRRLKDLENKETAVFGQGVTPDILFRNLLIKRKINKVRINYQYTSNSDIAQALLQHKVKTGVLSEPAVSILLSKDSTLHIVNSVSCEDFVDNVETDIFIQTAFLVSNKFSQKYPQVVKKVAREYRQSCNFVINQPDAAKKLAVELKLFPDVNTAEISLPLCNVRYVAAFALEHELLHYLDIFYKFDSKSIGGKLPDSNFLYKMN